MSVRTCFLLSSALLILSGCGAATQERSWLIDVQQGCKVPAEYSEYSTQLSWDGECDQDTQEAIGHGTLRWVEPDGSIGFARTCLRPEHRLSNCLTGTGFGGGG